MIEMINALKDWKLVTWMLLSYLKKFDVALANLCFFWENEDLNLWSTFSSFNMCWKVSFIARNKFGVVWEGLESKLAVTIIFPNWWIMLWIVRDRSSKGKFQIFFDHCMLGDRSGLKKDRLIFAEKYFLTYWIKRVRSVFIGDQLVF